MEKLSLERITSNQKNLEQILDSLKDGIIAHDMDRRIFYFNRQAERITGYTRDEVVGKDCHQALGGPFCGSRCSFCDDKRTLYDRSEYPINFISKSGEKRRLEMTSTLMRDQRDEPVGILATFRDVSTLFKLRAKAEKLSRFGNIIGKDAKMLEVFRQIRDVADYDFPVHISGDTGTGKELVAGAIHNESPRSGMPLVPINCGALPEGLIESELFGHVKGAFSGAIKEKKGRFEMADRGTVFLDEIGELPKVLQVKLLRFLQEGTFEKVGGEKTISVDVRVISATNLDLRQEVKQGRFREDLFYRLNVIPISIPPIRERKTDIPLLVEHFLGQSTNKKRSMTLIFSDEAMARMLDYSWPGNVRELQNAVQFAIVRCDGEIIMPDHLPLELRNLTCYPVKRGPSRKLDLESVREALIRTGGNKVRAAKVLGVGRATLYRFLGEYPELTQKGL
jgi:PAS domain S-box-containing protein